MGLKQSKNNNQEKELSSNLLTDVEASQSTTARSSFVSESEHKTISIQDMSHETIHLDQQDRDKRFVKEIKIEYRERDEVKKVDGPGGKKPKVQKFDW